MISAIRRTGYLIEDGARLGQYIQNLRDASRTGRDIEARLACREIADWLDNLPIGTYYAPVPQAELIEEVA